MRTAPKLMSVVAASAILLGLSGLASVAQAAETSPRIGATAAAQETHADPEAAAAAVGTQQFRVTNLSGHNLTLTRAWGTTGWPQMTETGFVDGDVAPPANTVLRPGQQMTFDVRENLNHGINARFKSDNGREGTVYMHVDRRTPSSDAQGFDAQWEKGGSAITYLGAPGSVVDIPASDVAAQTDAINNLGDKAGPGTSFTATSIVETASDGRRLRSERQPFGPGIKNPNPEPMLNTWDQDVEVVTTASIDIGPAAGPVMLRAVQNALIAHAGHDWPMSKTFRFVSKAPISPGQVRWYEVDVPAVKVTGDLTFTVGNTTWILRGVTFVVPSTVYNANYWSRERPLTQEEIDAPKDENYFLVDQPWATGPAGGAVRIADASHG